MVKLTVGGNDKFEALPQMRNVRWYLQSADFMAAEGTYNDRIKWIFEIVGGDVPDDSFIGKTHHVYTDMPANPDKLSSRSNLYQLVEGMSGGEFKVGDEIDTDDYTEREYIGMIKREPKREKIGNNWVESPTEKVSKLRDLYPAPTRTSRPASAEGGESKQRGYDWGDE